MIHTLVLRFIGAASLALSLGMHSPVMAQTQAQPAPSTSLVRGLPDFTVLVEKAGPAVVNIRTTERVARGPRGMAPLDENDPFYEFFRRFMPPGHPGSGGGRPGPGKDGEDRPEPRQRGVGSGFIISPDGYLLSNHHVVDGADEVMVTLTDKREFKAKIVGSDARTDVALLKIEAAGLPTLKLGNPDQLKVGEWVLAIGSPFGLESTVTAGIVSAKSRDTGDYLPFIQTDVAVNPGNSGGPLLNMAGEVVGINSQIYSRTGGFMGISFAIPIDEAQRVADQLRKSGRVVRGRIGVAIDEVTREVAEALGMKTASGALVRNVEPKGPAEQAGIEAGDIVLRFNGKVIEKVSDLPRLVGNTPPGAQATVEVWRRGEVKTLKVKVGQVEPEKVATAPKTPSKSDKTTLIDWMGLSLADAQAAAGDAQPALGVVVGAVKGPAERAGLRQGDIILSLNNLQVRSVAQFLAAAEKLDRKRTVVLLVRRGEGVQFVPLKP
jgi:serine protease Do